MLADKKLEDLPNDIYALFDPNETHEPSEENLEEFANNLKELFKVRLSKYNPPKSPLRFSSLGKPDCQMWFEAHPDPDQPKEEMRPQTYIKFLYGDLLEQVILFLAKEAGHNVEREQEEIDVDGVKGHIDAIIDGVLVDVKSASPYGYKKFENRTVTEDDPFGYVAQLSGYATELTPGKEAAWVAIDKVAGDICVSPLSPIVIKHNPPDERIEHLKQVIESEERPQRCAEPVPDGKSGNMRLPTTPCGYCAHKHRCHPDLRTFIYSTGPRFLTTVAREPDVPEVKKT